eukprot:EG_transcript_39569
MEKFKIYWLQVLQVAPMVGHRTCSRRMVIVTLVTEVPEGVLPEGKVNRVPGTEQHLQQEVGAVVNKFTVEKWFNCCYLVIWLKPLVLLFSLLSRTSSWWRQDLNHLADLVLNQVVGFLFWFLQFCLSCWVGQYFPDFLVFLKVIH